MKYSDERWDPAWSEAAKREVIATSFFVHRKKGTISALRRVVEPLGYLLKVTEWWQTEPQGDPGTFALRIGVLDTGITDEMYLELEHPVACCCAFLPRCMPLPASPRKRPAKA